MIHTNRKKIYLFYKSKLDPIGTTRVARSDDGLNFSFLKKVEKLPLKQEINPIFLDNLPSRKNFFDNGPIEIEGVVNINLGPLVAYHSKDKSGGHAVGIALFSKGKNPKLKWRSSVPVWESSINWLNKKISFIGLTYINGRIIGYWDKGKAIYAVIYPSFKLRNKEAAQCLHVCLNKIEKNPIIKPKIDSPWEAFNTFNPAAIYEGEKVHILYRAQGFDYVSTVGYASSQDGIHIDERLDEPIYFPKESFEYTGKNKPKKIADFYISGGGYGGVEDPRITKIDNRIYMTYVAFDGCNPPRVALTSISVDDFLNHRWLWEKAVLISPPNVVDKSCVIFPEKVNGKYVIMHRIYPNILIDFVDDLNFDGSRWLEGKYKIPPRPNMWDSRKIGAGAPPIKTKDGWLLIYQSVDDRDDKKYLIGAMLLDLNDPTKVLHRSKNPILTPCEDYENIGFKAGVVYPCGAVVIGNTLFVYYGGADSYVCVATAELRIFIEQLKYTETPVLEKAMIKKVFSYDKGK